MMRRVSVAETPAIETETETEEQGSVTVIIG